MRSKAEPDFQPLIAKDMFFVTKNGIGELRVKGRERLRKIYAWPDQGDMDDIARVRGPCTLSDKPEGLT